MEENQIKEIVYKHYNNGFHCAEAIVFTIYDVFPGKMDHGCRAASGFCGGIGGCHQDVCGALTGGIIALGKIHGRNTGDKDISKLKFLSAELRRLFIETFNTTVCKDVIEYLKDKPEFTCCKDVTAKTTWLLYNLIKNDFEQSKIQEN